jgi:hypothetical protein
MKSIITHRREYLRPPISFQQHTERVDFTLAWLTQARNAAEERFAKGSYLSREYILNLRSVAGF